MPPFFDDALVRRSSRTKTIKPDYAEAFNNRGNALKAGRASSMCLTHKASTRNHRPRCGVMAINTFFRTGCFFADLTCVTDACTSAV
jgi:hypothetical protein